MKESITVFFFVNNNHLSNVRTLQSIYKQDYPRINLVVCNDCTYGFQSERLLNNFEAGRGSNIQYLYFLENPWPMGECAAQFQLWDRIASEYYFVIHSGDQFADPSALQRSINTLRLDQSLAAAVSPLELWSEEHKKLISTTTITKDPESQGVFGKADVSLLRLHRVRDSMTVYRLEALKKLELPEQDQSRFLGRLALPALLEKGRRITVQTLPMCTYCEADIQDQPVAEPTQLGRNTLRHIEQLLQNQSSTQDKLFESNVPPAKAPKRNIHTMLYKISTLKKLCMFAGGAVLLAIAAALFMGLEGSIFTIIGLGFLALSACAGLGTLALLFCNLYYKKNPQRLVNH